MSFGVESYRAGSVFDRGCAGVWLGFGSLFVSLRRHVAAVIKFQILIGMIHIFMLNIKHV